MHMLLEGVISCHETNRGAEWMCREDGSKDCSVCNSVHPDLFIDALLNGGFISGWHWVDNEPHYCELADGKRFYYRHLIDMSCKWLFGYAMDIFQRSGVLFYWDGDWLKFHAVSEGSFFGKGSAMKITATQTKEADKLNKRYYRTRK
jgi:hypothetical protein